MTTTSTRSGFAATHRTAIARRPAGANLPNPGPPQFDYASATNNVVVLDLDPATRNVTARFVGGDGRVLFEHRYVL